MVELGITLIIFAIVIIAILYVVSIWIYKRAPANMGFIRTGFLGTKVCLGRGAVVLPVFHEVSWISLETIKLIVSRSRDQAILTADKIRVDVVAELYAHVGHTEEDLLTASRSLGEKTFDAEKVRNLLEAKVISAIRSYAATKTLSELHENRDVFAQSIKESVIGSFRADGLTLEEVTIVTMEQTGKEYFKADNVFDAEGLKIITEITSDARRKVHDTEKRTTVAIRKKDLDTQLELLEIEREEAFARAGQDKSISNEQAQQLGEKQVYLLDQQKSVEEREIANEVALERQRTERDIAVIEEGERRQISDIQKALALEKEQRDKEIALITKQKEEELANIGRNLELEKAEKDRQIELIEKDKQQDLADVALRLSRERAEKEREIELIAKEKDRQQAEIVRATAVQQSEETARDERHRTTEETSISMRKRALETKLAILEIDKNEAIAAAQQERDVSSEKAMRLSEQQRYILDRRLEVEQEEISKELAIERARIEKDASVSDSAKLREAAEIRRQLAREQEERDREIALVTKEEELNRAEVRRALAVEMEERERDIQLISKEQERESADIRRFQSREQEERDREIALVNKTQELEAAEAERLAAAANKEKVAHEMESVRIVADAERARQLARIESEKNANARKIAEENKADIARMHMIVQAEARKISAEQESDATLIRARATSEAQQITADGIEKEAGARGRAEMEIETLRVRNTQRMFEAEASGIEAKAGALKKYNEASTFLELAKMHIEAERDVHIDQAKAMGNALSGAQIRMYGGGDGTVDTIRGMFTSGFALGEIVEGVAQSLPEGLRQRFSDNGIRGLFGKPQGGRSQFKESVTALSGLVSQTMATRKDREIPVSEAIPLLENKAGDDGTLAGALALIKSANDEGIFDEVPFEKVWSLLQAAAKADD
jgi:uncharacterized membrane protein YqiK